MKAIGVILSFVSVTLASTGAAKAHTPPNDFQATVTRQGLLVRFGWNADVDPGFSDDEAAEFEIHMNSKCFAMPAGGKDDNTSLLDRGIDTNLEIEAEPYADVWNYYQPPLTWLGSDRAAFEWHNSCPEDVVITHGLVAPNPSNPTNTLYMEFGPFINNDGNFAVGVRKAKKLKSGKIYRFLMPLQPAEYSTDVLGEACPGTQPSETTSFDVRMQVMPNACTIKKAGIPVTSYCPFATGYAGCAEILEAPEAKVDYWLWGRICAPGAMGTPQVLASYASAPPADRTLWDNHQGFTAQCSDGDGDSWFATTSPINYGNRSGDCDDSDELVHPNAAPVCSERNDANCNRTDDCREPTCATQPTCAQGCGFANGPCCVGPAFCDANLSCEAGVCVTSESCFDGIPNQNEEGVDCGGQCPTPCCPSGNGLYCGDAVGEPDQLYDCENGVYSLASECPLGCVVNPPGQDDECFVVSCGDGACSNGETSSSCCVDCDCPSGSSCVSGTCELDETCTDGIHNQNEANIDCGGTCPACVCPGESSQACENCGERTRSCNVNGTWSAWGACLNQNNCPSGEACDGNLNICVGCGSWNEACCPGYVCQDESSLVCFAGSCRYCGGVSEPCCDDATIGMNGAECVSTPVYLGCDPLNLLCNPVPPQPGVGGAPVVVFYEDFESINWDEVGQCTMFDGISLWDVQDSLHSLVTTPGATTFGTQSLQWNGGGSVGGTQSSAIMTFPAGGLQASTAVELSFYARTSPITGPIALTISRSGCPTQNLTVSSSGSWTLYTMTFPSCGNTSPMVVQMGSIYPLDPNQTVLYVDNLRLRYVYPEVCDGVDNDGDGPADEGGVCPSCANQCSVGQQTCQDPVTSLDCFAPTQQIPCNHWDLPTPCNASNKVCVNGQGCRYCGLTNEPCCAGGTCAGTRACQNGVCVPISNCQDTDGDGFFAANCGGTDCNDAVWTTHPGAVEICNIVDDNCNGLADETFQFQTDENNCGGCGQYCAPGESCVNGTCI